jgi:hypothetical protein
VDEQRAPRPGKHKNRVGSAMMVGYMISVDSPGTIGTRIKQGEQMLQLEKSMTSFAEPETMFA